MSTVLREHLFNTVLYKHLKCIVDRRDVDIINRVLIRLNHALTHDATETPPPKKKKFRQIQTLKMNAIYAEVKTKRLKIILHIKRGFGKLRIF
jgi:hypothetical protein